MPNTKKKQTQRAFTENTTVNFCCLRTSIPNQFVHHSVKTVFWQLTLPFQPSPDQERKWFQLHTTRHTNSQSELTTSIQLLTRRSAKWFSEKKKTFFVLLEVKKKLKFSPLEVPFKVTHVIKISYFSNLLSPKIFINVMRCGIVNNWMQQ